PRWRSWTERVAHAGTTLRLTALAGVSLVGSDLPRLRPGITTRGPVGTTALAPNKKTPTAAVGVEEEDRESGRGYFGPEPITPPIPPLPPRIPPIPRIMSIIPPIIPIMPMPIEFSRFLVEAASSCR